MPTEADLEASVTSAEAAVAAETTVDASAGTLLTQITALYQAALANTNNSPPQAVIDRVTALTAALVAGTAGLQTAVSTNTPAASARRSPIGRP